MWKGRIPIKPAPYWYNTPIEDLDFEWSREEELEIERYCAQIRKNIEEEGGMTPKERFEATMWGRDKDRMCVAALGSNTYPTRCLDGFSDALKPIDVYQYPKLWVKAHLAYIARFNVDIGCWHAINYGEDLWGGQSKMIEYGNPILEGDAPIKSIEDLEGIEIPDPRKDALYPGFIWANRETKRFFEKYEVPYAIWGSICVGPVLIVQMGMMGMMGFAMGLARNPELVRRCCDVGLEWLTRYGKAFIDEVSPEAIYM